MDNENTEILKLVERVASKLEIDYFIVGATARDIVLNKEHNISTSARRTLDLDIGVCLSSKEDYEPFRSELLKEEQFSTTTNLYRLIFEKTKYLDLIPFGDIAGDKMYKWSEYDNVFSTIGFEEAFKYAINVNLNDSINIKVASLAGLVIMKLISWKEKYPSRSKDAVDIKLILENYIEAGNTDRIFDELPEFFDSESFDYELTGPLLLGKDILAMAKPKTLDIIETILQEEIATNNDLNLVHAMLRPNFDPKQTQLMLKKLQYLVKGIMGNRF